GLPGPERGAAGGCPRVQCPLCDRRRRCAGSGGCRCVDDGGGRRGPAARVPAACRPYLRRGSRVTNFPHLSDAGEVHMVDVGGKDVTDRVAVAECLVTLSESTRAALF